MVRKTISRTASAVLRALAAVALAIAAAIFFIWLV
jgi:hypothetical protein